MARELVAGPESGPQPPFPIKLSGRIIKGFGRGSKELGIPTANIPVNGLDVGGHTDIESGVYFGWAGLSQATSTGDASTASAPTPPSEPSHSGVKSKASHAAGAVVNALIGSSEDPYAATERRSTVDGSKCEVYPMVLSIGYNPYYKNTVRSVEVHIIHKFDRDFYNSLLNISILGFIRKEQDYNGLEALIADIKTDIEVAGRSLERKAYAKEAKDKFLKDFNWAKEPSGTAS